MCMFLKSLTIFLLLLAIISCEGNKLTIKNEQGRGADFFVSPVAILYDLPLTGHSNLNVIVGGVGVSSYRYKFGNNLLDCSDASTFSDPVSISNKITDSIGADGNKKLCVLGVDEFGNQQVLPTEHSWIKTSITPTIAITSPLNGSYVNSTNTSDFPLSGTCSSDGINNVSIEGSASTVTTNCSSGLWSVDLDFSAADEGPVFVLVKLTDSTTGNIGQVIGSFTKSTNLPDIAITSPAVNAYINNANKTSFAISGTCDVLSATPNIVVSGGISDVSATCNGSIWAASLTFPDDTTADITIEATITNPAGSTFTDSLALKLDTENPEVAIVSPAASAYINSTNLTNFTVSGTCSDIGTNNLVIRDGSNVVMETLSCTGTGWTTGLDFTGYSEGSQSISISIADAAGNTSSDNRTFTKSTLVPGIAITSPMANAVIHKGNRHAFNVSGTCDRDDAEIVISGASSNVSTTCEGTTWNADLVFADNVASTIISLVATISDSAGNSSNATLNVIHDTQSPVVAFSSPAEDSYINSSNMNAFPVAGFCMEPGTNNVTLEDENNGVLDIIDCSGDGTWSTNLDLSSHDEGTIAITVSQAVGAVFYPDSRTFIKDSVHPEISITNLVDGVCVSEANKNSYIIQGACTNGDGNINLSSVKISSTQTVACVSGSFTTTVDIVTTGMNDREDFGLNFSQMDSAGNSTIKTLTLKHISTPPNISFDGWDDVYAVGKKTYVDGNPAEDGVVRIKWKEWGSANTCQPEGVKVYRAGAPDLLFTSRTLVSAPGGIPPVSRSFTDETLSDSDFNKGWYYSLKLLVAGQEYEITMPEEVDEVRVIAPPANMALVHRWITNQEVCGLMSSPTDPLKNYRCLFEGQGKVMDAGIGYHDMQHDLLVDRFELGCKVSTTCGSGEDTLCVSSKFSGASDPSAGLGIPGAIGSVFYANSSNGNCWVKNGALDTDWTFVAYSTPSEQANSVTNEAHSPPIGFMHKDDFSNSCNGQTLPALTQIHEYSDNAPNGAVINKRLLRQKEWKAAAAWSREDYPAPYTSASEWIDNLEKSNYVTGDTSLRTGKCNTNGNKANLSAGDRSFLSEFEIADNAFETGSKIATRDCVSRYGIQDMVGNLIEMVSDELNCSGLTCNGVVSSVDPDNTDMVGFSFDGLQGPGGQAVANWGLRHGSYGAAYFNAVLGLPLVSNASGAVSVSDWNALNYFSNDNYVLEIDGSKPIRNLLLGGFWAYGESSQYGRWLSRWDFEPVSWGAHMGTRCMAPVN